jgi:hypothetical protein
MRADVIKKLGIKAEPGLAAFELSRDHRGVLPYVRIALDFRRSRFFVFIMRWVAPKSVEPVEFI